MQGVRERKRADSRSTTIDAAYALFLERSYDAVTVADICAAADIARRTFFRYFSSKAAVLDEPLAAMTLRVGATISAAPTSEGDAAVVRRALTESAMYALEHRTRLVQHHHIVAGSTTSASSPYRQLGEHERLLARQLQERQGDAGAPGWPTRLLVSRAVAVLRVWLDEIMRPDSLVDAPQLLAEMFDADPWFTRVRKERSSHLWESPYAHSERSDNHGEGTWVSW